MNSYLVHFITYTLAMVGFFAIAVLVYKKTAYSASKNPNKEFLEIENTLRLSATKTVYVLKAGKEKFLIAGDAANTTMLAKLEENNDIKENYSVNKTVGLTSDVKSIQKIGRG